jgi:Bacterial archaeo-eukaryotic release factor family 3
MSIYRCPVCPLIFQGRSEVEAHLQHEHRSRAKEAVDLGLELAAAGVELSRDRLQVLESAHAHPSVTLLMATTPGPTMSSLDVARLRHLAHAARRRLAAEPGAGTNPAVEHRLTRALAAAESNPTDRGLAILVSAHHLALFPLPFAPRDRAVIDPRFATRDLQFALQDYPRYRVVVLGPSPRVLEGYGRRLADTPCPDVGQTPTPLGRSHQGLGRRSTRPERGVARRADHQAGCALADGLLDRRVHTAGSMPLIVVGDNRWRSAFRRRSRHAASVAAEIRGSRRRASAAALAELAQPGLAAWRRAQQTARIARLQQSDADGTVTWGLANVWRAVRDGSADHIWVDHTYAQPGRRIPGVDGIETTSDPGQPGIRDDLVDDLIQLAAARGITVDLLDDGCLDRPEAVAARIPAARHHPPLKKVPLDTIASQARRPSPGAVRAGAGHLRRAPYERAA